MERTSPDDRLLPRGLRPLRMSATGTVLTIHAVPEAGSARCPLCGTRSGRTHCRYGRIVADLPWRGIAVTVRVWARKFFCENLACERRIFCERLPARKYPEMRAGLSTFALLLVLGLCGRA